MKFTDNVIRFYLGSDPSQQWAIREFIRAANNDNSAADELLSIEYYVNERREKLQGIGLLDADHEYERFARRTGK
jgi:hypothetical protein